MTPSLVPILTFSPCASGWRATLHLDEPIYEERPTFSEAVTAALALRPQNGFSVTLALPVRSGVFERFTLPSIDTTEIQGMVRLQFEKLLPYPVEETELQIQILHQSESESTVMVCSVHEPELSKFCAPLLENHLPEQVTFAAFQRAALGPDSRTACGIWREGDDTLFGIFENRRLSYVELVMGDLTEVLPRALVRADMAGANTSFESILLDDSLSELREPIETALGSTATALPDLQDPSIPQIDITPQAWKDQRTRRAQRRRLRRQMFVSGMLYGAALAFGLVVLAFRQKELDQLQHRAAALRPRADTILERQQHWRTMAPAVDPQRYGVELFFQIWECLPSPDTRLNRFEISGEQLTIEGEAPNAQKAIAFGEALKGKSTLNPYRFETAQPLLLPNDHAQFRIFGKP